MKKYLLFLVVSVFIIKNELKAQPIPKESIEDQVIGWMKVYHFKGAKESLKVDDKSYSIAQLSISDSLANWMQASYIPKGGLGDVAKMVTEKLGLYNQHTRALPPSYGVYAKTYVFLKYNSKHEMVPENNLGTYWGIYANQVPGWPVRHICTPTSYFFTLPSFAYAVGGEEETKKIHDMTGMEMGASMEEALRRMERGEDPEQIENEMGDLLEGEDPFVLPEKKVRASQLPDKRPCGMRPFMIFNKGLGKSKRRPAHAP